MCRSLPCPGDQAPTENSTTSHQDGTNQVQKSVLSYYTNWGGMPPCNAIYGPWGEPLESPPSFLHILVLPYQIP